MVSPNFDIINEAKNFVKDSMKSNDPSHDWNHVERVYKMSVYLANAEKKLDQNLQFDLDVVELAALFHDIVDFKYNTDKSNLDEISEKILNDFLSQFNYPKQKIDKIFYIISNISWRKQLEASSKEGDVPFELKVVRDADRLDAIGAIGVARCMAFTGAKNRPFYQKDLKPIENMTADQYNKQTVKNDSTAINHFHEKLVKIKDKMLTETGKKLALDRHNFMVQYLDQFEKELQLV
ncbi:phosphohydrolase [Brachionus plicatilis]|uniref:Phosphohydrolase n=1 Tax=Brachionus plicatilis TaxID=10195 RepID=A0A3M7SF41_BRAPC|nr:phosphohydrolase [Brachionus plicatilis]